jgi:hypothetical protein
MDLDLALDLRVRRESRRRRVKKEPATMASVPADSATLPPPLNPRLVPLLVPPFHPGDLLALETLLRAPLPCTPAGRRMRTYPQATVEGLSATIPCADQFPLQGGHRVYLNSSW